MPIFRYIPKPFDGSPKFTVDVADEAAAVAEVGLGNFDELLGFTTMEPDLYANQFVNTKSVSREGDHYFGIDKLAPAVAAGMIKKAHAAVIISEQIEPPYNILVKQKSGNEAFISGVLIGETVPDGGDCTIAASGTFTSEDIGLVITNQEVGAYVYVNDEGDLTWNNDSARALGWLLANDIFYIDVGIYNGMCASPGDGFINAKGLHLDQSSAAGHGVEFINSTGNIVGRIHSDNDSGTNKLKISASSNEADGCQVVFTNRDGSNLMDINPDDNLVGMNHNRLTDIKDAEYPGDAANFSQIQRMINYQSGYYKLNVGGGSSTIIEYWQNGYYFKMSTTSVEVRLLEGSSEESPTCYAKYQQSTKPAYVKFYDKSGNLMNKPYHPHELMPEQTMEIFGAYGSNDYLVSISSVHPASTAAIEELEAMEIKPSKTQITGLENTVKLNAENTRYFANNGRNDTKYQKEFRFDINVSGRGAFEIENHCDYYPPNYPEILVYLINEQGESMGGVKLGVGQGSNIRYDTSITDVQGFSDGYFVTPIHLWYKKNLSTSSALLFSEVSAGSEAKEIITKEFVYRFESESEFQKAVTLPDNVFAYVDHIIKIDGTKLKNVEFDQEYSDGAIRVILSELCSGVAIIKAIKYES
mgnify:CR=1 FL=1|jgi:hypothetical protein